MGQNIRIAFKKNQLKMFDFLSRVCAHYKKKQIQPGN